MHKLLTLFHLVHHLPAADAIIVLAKDGQIAQQGSYIELQSSDGYIRDLALGKTSKEKVAENENVNDVALVPPQADPVREDSEALDLKRQTGDMSLYKFYFKSVSAAIAIFWLGLTIIYTGLSKMPCKYRQAPIYDLL